VVPTKRELFIRQQYIAVTSIKIILLILLGSILVHLINTPVSRFIFYGMLALYLIRSKDSTVDIALVFIFLAHPFYLFNSEPFSWFVMITQSVGFSFSLVFVLVILLKYLFIHPSKISLRKDLLKSFYLPVFVYLVFLLFWSLVFGHSARSLFFIVSFLPSFLLFLVLPKIFNIDQLYYFNGIVFFVNLIHISVSQIDIILGGRITDFLVLGKINAQAIFEDDEVVRLTGGILIALYSFVTGLYYITIGTRRFNSGYLWIIVFVSLLFIMNSATRGWMIASGVFLLLFLVYYYNKITYRRLFIAIIFTVIAVYILLPGKIKSNLIASFRRLSTVEYVFEGDLTAGGTARRFDIRGPQVLTRFKESPFFGFGFSKVSADYYDGHVGNHNLLLVGGIVGFILFWATVLGIVLYLLRLEGNNIRFKGVFVFGIAMLSIMIIHSTSRTMVSFYMPSDVSFLIAVMFNNINAQYYNNNG